MSRKMQNPTHAQELVALRIGRPLEDVLREMYVERGMSQADIALELGISRQTVAMWVREFALTRPIANTA